MKKVVLALILALSLVQVSSAQQVRVSPLSGPVGTPFSLDITLPTGTTSAEVLLDGSPLSSPYKVQWSPQKEGTYTVSVLTRDKAGVNRTSPPVSFKVTPQVTVPPPPPVDPCLVKPITGLVMTDKPWIWLDGRRTTAWGDKLAGTPKGGPFVKVEFELGPNNVVTLSLTNDVGCKVSVSR